MLTETEIHGEMLYLHSWNHLAHYPIPGIDVSHCYLLPVIPLIDSSSV
jgi:hypothetical protein